MKKLERTLKFLRGLTRDERWAVKQELAHPSRYYGGDGTIHGSTELHVETHHGKVVAVWFRCQPLPFVQREANADRATEMERMYYDEHGQQRWMTPLTGVEVFDGPPWLERLPAD